MESLFTLQHHEQVEKYSTTLETLLFTQDLDPNILDVFQQFVALRIFNIRKFANASNIFLFKKSL